MYRYIYYTTCKRSLGGVYWFHPVRLSVRPSISLSPSVDIILSMHVLRDGWNFHIDWMIFLYFTSFFSVFGLGRFFITRNYILKIMKNFD